MITPGILIVYFLVLLFIGIRSSYRIQSRVDLHLAGRRLSAPVLVATLLATWIGSGALFSIADLSYHHGYSSLIGSAGGWTGILVITFFAGRIRRFGQFTVPDILEARYSTATRIMATGAIILAYTTVVSYQIRAGGWIINLISSGKIPLNVAMICLTGFVVLYTSTAGMLSLARMDIVNGIIMILGIFLALPFLIRSGGGIRTIAANVTPRIHPILGNMTWVQAFGYFAPTFLLALGNANAYQRFYSARDEHTARKSVIGWFFGVMVLGVALQSLAVIGSSMFKGLSDSDSGKIILLVARDGLPVFIGSFLFASIMAIVISTANGFLLVPAVSIMRDVVQRFVWEDISDRHAILGTRIALVLLGMTSYAIVGFFPRVLDAAFTAYTVYGAAVTPALIAAFFWKRATPAAGTISILSGTLVTVFWKVAEKFIETVPFGLPAIYPAFLCSVTALILVSVTGKKPEASKWRSFIDPD